MSDQSAPRNLGVPQFYFCRPLWQSLRDRAELSIRIDQPSNLAISLRQHKLHAALLSPIDYAKDYAMYRIVPSVTAASRGESRAVLLYFAKGLHSIQTIAVDPRSTSEIVLAQLILGEKYDIRPTFVPWSNPQNLINPRTDATLVVPDKDPGPLRDGIIDVVDEWTDLTDLPYVHAVWVCRENDLTRPEMGLLIDAAHRGIEEAMKDEAEHTGDLDTSVYRFEYTLDNEHVSAMTEFLRMAYYHRVLQDIPDVKMHVLDEKEFLPPEPSGLSLN